MKDNFRQKLVTEMNKHHFLEFDTYIVRKMGFGAADEPISDIDRRLAYKQFRKLTNMSDFVSLPTMKKWFGIGGRAVPRREKIFEMAFAMGLGAEETEEYLLKGIRQAGFQINDYQEAILMYGLYNNLSYKTCLDMIQSYRLSIETQKVYMKTYTTKQLMGQFMHNYTLPPDKFLLWMIERSEHFKGYSVTVMNYLEQYKKKIVYYIRHDASRYLNILLSETGYKAWERKHILARGSKRQLISKFIKNNNTISSDLAKNILELSKIVYSDLEPNTMILSAIYTGLNNGRNKLNNTSFTDIHSVTAKYLSDLYNYPLMQEREIRTSKAIAELESMDKTSPCPEWIVSMIEYYSKGKVIARSPEDALNWLGDDYDNHRMRRILAKREDILPMILYVAQRNYLQTINEDMTLYNREDAIEQFYKMANSSLTACNMELLSDEYELDVALVTCFQDDDMYTYQDVLDIVYAEQKG